MEVVKSNFAQVIPQFEDHLRQASFVAFDLEFTGIRGKPEGWTDTVSERYQKMKRVASQFSIIQVGISIFIPRGDTYEACPYNFYIFPDEGAGKNPRIILEVSAIAFNKQHNMDFNKWIYEGIPYVDDVTDKELFNKYMIVKEDLEEEAVINLTREVDRVKTQEWMDKIIEWNAGPETELQIPGLNSFLRKYLYQWIHKEFPHIETETIANDTRGRNITIILHKFDSVQKEVYLKQKAQEKEESYYGKIGFRRIFSLLVEAKKPLVGHNMMFDLLFFTNSFHGFLPDTYREFKNLLQTLFPSVYDTRYLMNNVPGLLGQFEQNTVSKGLGDFYDFLVSRDSNYKKPLLAGIFQRYAHETFRHEAGYDAYMTGCCFIEVIKLISYDTICQFRNKVPLFRCFFDINFEGEDRLSVPPHTYHASGEVKNKFRDEALNVMWVDEFNCFITILEPGKKNRIFEQAQKDRIHLTPVTDYFNNKRSP